MITFNFINTAGQVGQNPEEESGDSGEVAAVPFSSFLVADSPPQSQQDSEQAEVLATDVVDVLAAIESSETEDEAAANADLLDLLTQIPDQDVNTEDASPANVPLPVDVLPTIEVDQVAVQQAILASGQMESSVAPEQIAQDASTTETVAFEQAVPEIAASLPAKSQFGQIADDATSQATTGEVGILAAGDEGGDQSSSQSIEQHDAEIERSDPLDQTESPNVNLEIDPEATTPDEGESEATIALSDPLSTSRPVSESTRPTVSTLDVEVAEQEQVTSEAVGESDSGSDVAEEHSFSGATDETEDFSRDFDRPDVRRDVSEGAQPATHVDIDSNVSELSNVAVDRPTPVQSPVYVRPSVVTESALVGALNQVDETFVGVNSTDVNRQVISAITQGVETSESESVKTVILELHPAELGRLKIQVEQTAETIATQIIASEISTSEILAGEKSTLEEALSELGFSNANVDVSHNQNGESPTEFGGFMQGSARSGGSSQTTTPSQEHESSSGGLNIIA